MYSVYYVQCVLCTVCIMYSMYYLQCVLCTVCTMYSVYYVQYVVCTVCTMYSVHYVRYVLCTVCTIYSVYYLQCVLCTVCTMYIVYYVQCVLCTVCTMYSVHYIQCVVCIGACQNTQSWSRTSSSPANPDNTDHVPGSAIFVNSHSFDSVSTTCPTSSHVSPIVLRPLSSSTQETSAQSAVPSLPDYYSMADPFLCGATLMVPHSLF